MMMMMMMMMMMIVMIIIKVHNKLVKFDDNKIILMENEIDYYCLVSSVVELLFSNVF